MPAPASPSLRLIVHADDCGLTRSISEDIFACLAHGPLHSVSVLMGGSWAAESLRRLAGLPQTRVCLHLNLLEGRCTAPIGQVRPLADAAGVFRCSLGQLLAALAGSVGRRRKALLIAIRDEFEAQIAAFAAGFPQWRQRGGLRLDGHLHVHAIPALSGVMRELIREHSPAYVRLPREPAHLPPLPAARLLTGCARRALLAHWSVGLAALLNQTGVAHNAFLCGLVSGGSLTAALAAASLAAIRRQDAAALVEIMCHPGGQPCGGPPLRHDAFYQSPARQAEKAMLLDGSLNAVLQRYGAPPAFAAAP
ncbi:ChbG/HpnK family deacetylase [Desulfovibrio legallii]|jgi:predicted glycoside hydrolase/deacetylase ChbG (UPF0249 family)|uniref:Predicted glycoside hydrolase or deacetylase ChbG, UPF0249 family n=1 Tax=Desulfovibrio legallii TaxID=571438 RepID=A0A1G7PEX7_9BACT|nr:ChbG/HpnK family deacetylase [Desulfovibrio legallii]SDF84030.1 Predicted glycoside hydrolase or deacetylase ChbG, UPF0249 family [Desulfovibrio legallii]